MSTKPETRLQQRIRRRLEQEVGGYWRKIWGGPYQHAGIADILGCVNGLFFAFEAKTDKGKPSDLQLEEIRLVKLKGGGVSCIIRSPEEAVDVVRKTLARAEGSRRLRPRSIVKVGGRRAVQRARHRQDHYKSGRT